MRTLPEDTASVAYPFDGFATERLEVRDWRGQIEEPAFLAALARVLTPEVLAPLPPPLQLGNGGVDAWIAARAEEAAVYAISDRETGGLLGLVILAYAPSEREVHVGYLLARATWGRGYASEVVAGLIDALLGVAPVEVFGGVAAGNPASARVLVKCGFTEHRGMSRDGTTMFARRLERPWGGQ